MLIAHKEAISKGTILNIKITQTDDSNEKTDFNTDIEVMSYLKSEVSGIFGSGVKFLDNNDEQRSQIRKMINTFAVRAV